MTSPRLYILFNKRGISFPKTSSFLPRVPRFLGSFGQDPAPCLNLPSASQDCWKNTGDGNPHGCLLVPLPGFNGSATCVPTGSGPCLTCQGLGSAKPNPAARNTCGCFALERKQGEKKQEMQLASRLAACTHSHPRKEQPEKHETKCKASSGFLLVLEPSVSADIPEATKKFSLNTVLLILKTSSRTFPAVVLRALPSSFQASLRAQLAWGKNLVI